VRNGISVSVPLFLELGDHENHLKATDELDVARFCLDDYFTLSGHVGEIYVWEGLVGCAYNKSNRRLLKVPRKVQIPNLDHFVEHVSIHVPPVQDHFGGAVEVVARNGFMGLASCELYNALSKLFSSTSSMALPRFVHTSTFLSNGNVLICGGLDRNSGNGGSNSCELYNSTSGLFSETSSLITGRYFHTATGISNNVLICAGFNSAAAYLNSCEMYNSSSGLFSASGSLASFRYVHVAVLLSSNDVLICGATMVLFTWPAVKCFLHVRNVFSVVFR
jgi:hypothetical protein